jgi:hypothetical protein
LGEDRARELKGGGVDHSLAKEKQSGEGERSMEIDWEIQYEDRKEQH